MKKIKLLLIAGLVMMFAMVGCRSLPPSVRTVQTHDTITVEKTVTLHDTVFLTPSSEVTIQVPWKSLVDTVYLKPISKQIKNARLTISKTKDGIVADCFCDSLAIKAQLRNTLEKEYRSVSNTIEIPPDPIPTPWYLKFLQWSGASAWLLAIIFLTIKLKK